MATAWYISTYRYGRTGKYPFNDKRYIPLSDYPQLFNPALGEKWNGIECGYAYCVVKVLTSQASIDTISAITSEFTFITQDMTLKDVIPGLNTNRMNTIKNVLVAMGYPLAEINAQLGSNIAQWRVLPIETLLHYAIGHRMEYMLDTVNQVITATGGWVSPTMTIEQLDLEIS